jgi:hypothetical protein
MLHTGLRTDGVTLGRGESEVALCEPCGILLVLLHQILLDGGSHQCGEGELFGVGAQLGFREEMTVRFHKRFARLKKLYFRPHPQLSMAPPSSIYREIWKYILPDQSRLFMSRSSGLE